MSGVLSSLPTGAGSALNRFFPLNLSFQFTKTEIGSLMLDLLISEKIKWNGKVTEYPVEDGSTISDHITEGTKELTISGTISNAEAYSFNFSTGMTKMLNAIEVIEKLKKDRALITVTTKLTVYQDMGLESVEVTRNSGNPKDGNWMDITATLKRIKKVALRRADVPAAAPASGRTGQTAARTAANPNAARPATATTETPGPDTSQTAALRATNALRRLTDRAPIVALVRQ